MIVMTDDDKRAAAAARKRMPVWRRCACGMYYTQQRDGSFIVKSSRFKDALRAKGDTIPEAIGNVRNLMRRTHDAQFAHR